MIFKDILEFGSCSHLEDNLKMSFKVTANIRFFLHSQGPDVIAWLDSNRLGVSVSPDCYHRSLVKAF